MKEYKIGIIGLGYVGLPLALEFSKRYKVIGFDTNKSRVNNLLLNIDHTNEVSSKDLRKTACKFTSDIGDLSSVNCFIVTVPTPIYKNKIPDLRPLKSASKLVASLLKNKDIVIYESTVYPGATEEICLPILESNSGLILNNDFSLGYSPERINPGDKKHRLTNIKKVVSASNNLALAEIAKLYSSIVTAGVHKAASIKIAEAAKVIENTQRDLNIAFINELSLLFSKLEIDTEEVLKAAETKWNFLSFRPGLVGGHCIGVDPYYLTYKSKQIGFNPKITLAGRGINDAMPAQVVKKLKQNLIKRFGHQENFKILILGATFKENCPDTRNSKVSDLVSQSKIKLKGCEVNIIDPYLDYKEIFGAKLISKLKSNYFHAVIIAVGHKEFRKYDEIILRSALKKNGIIFDLKYLLPTGHSDLRI